MVLITCSTKWTWCADIKGFLVRLARLAQSREPNLRLRLADMDFKSLALR